MKRPEIIEREARGKNPPGQTHRFAVKAEYDKVTGDPRNLWISHDILEEFQKELKDRKGKESYEDFIYGFMYHFDNHSPKEKWDVDKEGAHKIYFKWVEVETVEKKVETDVKEVATKLRSVDIYIIPAPIDPFKKGSTVINAGVDPERPPAPPPPPANP